LVSPTAGHSPVDRSQSASVPQPFVEEQRQHERERSLRERPGRNVDAGLPPQPRIDAVVARVQKAIVERGQHQLQLPSP
jgi:hypothetical protein